MDLVDMMNDYIRQPEESMRAIFEKAMVKRIETTGYTMSDLMFDLYKCQREIALLKGSMIEVRSAVVDLKARVTKKKKAG